ncbi:MAG: dimethylarginine dimethylaminohydrolase family protein [Acidimicrobiales bacterium]
MVRAPGTDVDVTADASFGVSSMTGQLEKVAMRRPGAILTADHRRWHYASPIEPEALVEQYDTFVRLIEADGAEIHWLPDDDGDDLADSIFTFDPSFMTPAGAVILRPGKDLRKPEAELHARFYGDRIPVVGTIEAPGMVEGGDCFWLDRSTLAAGRGFRTNEAGIEQLRLIVGRQGITVEAFDLPYLDGPDACLHLLSVVSPLSDDLALVYAPLLPVALYQRMEAMGYELLHAPEDEFQASIGLNLNVLATSPRRCIAVDGFPQTVALMRAAGCSVTVFQADKLCIPCEGGPTCLTRPLHRR